MRTAPVSIAALLLGTAVLVIGTLVTFATTLSTDPQSVGTLAILILAVLGTAILGIRTDKRPRTPYW